MIAHLLQTRTDAASSSDIAIVGRSCRLPGAPSIADLWRLLVEGRCAVTSIPTDRWGLVRALHPRLAEPGRTYTWAAGVLDDVWGFDAAAFSISPREAEQMDPQQRLLLELTWEALEDAGIRPSAIAGSDAGVFVGASAVDHATLRMIDMTAADAYMMTGNTLSVIANRLSYIFDLHGPSFTVDTACSSSLVALSEAVANLRNGRIETAIVGGVSLLLSPQAFVGFSQAGMLSPIGLCQAFSAQADGYVRGEGGVVLVLKTREAAIRDGDPIYGFVVAAEVNSDGRTNGISLPSQKYQGKLLEKTYLDRGLDPDDLAFVEAHGTGTPVGDPAEAAALGAALGRRRASPLPIGSLKTNIGHLEAAAGLGGLLKALLALEHDLLPRSLHCNELNPAIDFADLNLVVAQEPKRLLRTNARRRLAGVNAFGFGGTNAHVVLAEAPKRAAASVDMAPTCLFLSAHSRAALSDLAAAHVARFEGVDEAGALAVASAAAENRDRLTHRMVVPFGRKRDMISALRHANAGAVQGTAVARAAPVAFVFSGNGSQFAGMGRAAFARNAAFRARIETISNAFADLAGWSIVEALQSDDLAHRLQRTQVAQPLLFAIQSAACFALGELGLRPDMTLGHSVGEIAAAEAAGILDLDAALQVVFARSRHQELVYGAGAMAVLVGSRAGVDAAVAELPDLEIAAFNSPRAFTVAGDATTLSRLPTIARHHKVRMIALDLAYPFHSAAVAPVKAPLLRDLAGLKPTDGHTSFISSVTGGVLDGIACDATYWWRNVREPVRFAEAVTVAAQAGARVFVEIGPQATLLSHIGDTIDESIASIATLAAMDRRGTAGDPLATTVATAFVRGARIDETKVFGFGPRPGSVVPLPLYPWQRKHYRLPESSESPGLVRPGHWHPLIGARVRPDQLEWRASLDTTLHPWLADHCVQGRVILPGAAFVEMALAVARDWLGGETVRITELDISSPMVLAADAALEVACRLSAVANHLEILSRPRSGASNWQAHATAKIVRDTTTADLPPNDAMPPEAKAVTAAEIYAMADRAGLHYGPAFRKLASATPHGASIHLDLLPEDADRDLGLDPARLDACFHALVLAFSAHRWADEPTAFVPIRFGDVLLIKPGATFVSASIEIHHRGARALVVDVTIRDAGGDVVARLRDVRFQALRTAQRAQSQLVRARLRLSSAPTSARVPISSVSPPHASQAAPPITEDFVLLEGWATSTALQIARELAPDGPLDPDAIVGTGRWPEGLRPWLVHLLDNLARSGLSRADALGHHIDREAMLPSPSAILASIAREHPDLSAELMLACATDVAIAAVMAEKNPERAPLARAIETYEGASTHAQAAALTLGTRLDASAETWPKNRAMRILQIGQSPLSDRMKALVEIHQARLTIFEPDRRRGELLRLGLSLTADVTLVEREEDLPTAGFDVVVAAGTLRRCAQATGTWWAIRRAMAPGGILAAIEPGPSFFRDLTSGLDAQLTGANVQVSHRAQWTRMLKGAGLGDVVAEAIATQAGTALLLTARTEAAPIQRHGSGPAIIVGDAKGAASSALATLLAAAGYRVSIESTVSLLGDVDAAEPLSLVVFLPGGLRAGEAPAAAVRDRCMALKHLSEQIGSRAAHIWLVVPGSDAISDAVLAFARTLANEVPTLDVRRVEATARLTPDVLAERLRDVIVTETTETEIVIGADATRVRRFETVAIDSLDQGEPAEAARLAFGEGAGFDRLRWQAVARRAPAPGEVEIEVAAIGVNFRDVMFGLGLLPDDLLEHGFAGPALGLECTGRVTRVGAGVKDRAPGDRVMAFARDAFSTHVTTPAALVTPVPEAVTLEAAAGIPVVFLTAFYALIERAQLKPREWVLIHGGAGGVGLAAMQIALWRGAKIIATAGTPEKRELLRVLGATHVFDSRSGEFVDEVRRVTGDGVAVALNSLAGEPMERTIGLLRPFGRFVELGKRDYVGNTHVGLRPFRRNLAYFGVDLDQLLVGEPTIARRLMRRVMRLFAEGALTPLPYRTFEAAETADAFRLMQAAGHVGKLVLRPPNPRDIQLRVKREAWRAAPDKAHLVTGGLGGFGLATAQWLADRGARHLVLVGRSGLVDGEALQRLATLTARGVSLQIEALDVADEPALAALMARFGSDLPPLAGVVHAAMVLDDALIPNLTVEAFERVLRPKVNGATHLDRLTRDLPLDYFILYSSATTLVGNPGQAAYVAANGYLEGLARGRRRAGLPGLAVAWGAIADVGVVARSAATKELLASRAGVVAVPAAAALDQLGEVLALASKDPEDAVVALASMSWATARKHLHVLQAPAYRALASQEQERDDKAKLDIAALVAAHPPDSARKLIGGLIVEEIARVLRLPREDVPRTTALSEIGLDSLMAVELALGLENRFTLDRPLSATASGFSVNELADHVIGLASGGAERHDLDAHRVIARHLGPEALDAAE